MHCASGSLVFAVTGPERKPVGSTACFGTETLPHMAKVLETLHETMEVNLLVKICGLSLYC